MRRLRSASLRRLSRGVSPGALVLGGGAPLGVGRRVWVAARSVSTLPVLLAALVTAILLAAPSLLAVGAAAYAALVVRLASTARLRRRALAERDRTDARLPAPAQLDDPTLQSIVTELRLATMRIERACRSVPPSVGADARGALDELARLEENAAHIVRRAEEAWRFLRACERDVAVLDLEAIERAFAAAGDESVRHEYRLAAAARREQLAYVDRIAAERERMLAVLTRVVSAVEAVPPWIYQLRMLDARAHEDVVADTDERLLSLEERLWEPLAALQGVLAGR